MRSIIYFEDGTKKEYGSEHYIRPDIDKEDILVNRVNPRINEEFYDFTKVIKVEIFPNE